MKNYDDIKLTHNAAIRKKYYLNIVCMFFSSTSTLYTLNCKLIIFQAYQLFYLVRCNFKKCQKAPAHVAQWTE